MIPSDDTPINKQTREIIAGARENRAHETRARSIAPPSIRALHQRLVKRCEQQQWQLFMASRFFAPVINKFLLLLSDYL